MNEDIDLLIETYFSSNDEQSLFSAVAQIQRWLYPKICRIIDKDDAKDILQDSFIKALSAYKPERGKFCGLINKIAIRDAFKLKKKKYRQVDITDHMNDVSLSDDSEPEKIAASVDAEIVHQALDSLPEKYRVPLVMFYFDDLDTKTIATILKKPQGTVQSLLDRGRERLRKILNRRMGNAQG